MEPAPTPRITSKPNPYGERHVRSSSTVIGHLNTSSDGIDGKWTKIYH